MELRGIRGGTRDELFSKQYDIGIGISLGNRWFTPENIVEAVRWALPYTKQHVIVYVADSIHAINLEVRNRWSPEKSLRRATAAGEKLMGEVEALVEESFESSEKARVHFAFWKGLYTDAYQRKLDYLYSQYRGNPAFREAIHSIVRAQIGREERVFTADDIDAFGTYIIEELPEIVCRVPIDGMPFDAFAYPHDGILATFAKDLQKGAIFPEIRDAILDTEPKVFLEVR